MKYNTVLITGIATLLAIDTYAAEEPAELVSMRKSWEKARQTAVMPVDKKYRDALSALKLRFTQAGNLDAAIAIQREIEVLDNANLVRKKREITLVKSRSATTNSKGTILGNIQSESENATDIFDGKSVNFNWKDKKQLHFKINSPTPITKITYTGVAFDNFTMEVDSGDGNLIKFGPRGGGNNLHTYSLDVPNLESFDLVIRNNVSTWAIIKSIVLE